MTTARIKLTSVDALSADYSMELYAAGRIQGDRILLPLADAHAIKMRHRGVPAGKNKLRGLGDLIHAVAMPIAKALKLPCVDQKTQQLRPESPCSKRRAELNKAVPFKE